MRLFRNSDKLTPVRWYRCPPDAEDIPYLHPFGSHNWFDEPASLPVGEPAKGGRWDPGADELGMAGERFCGTKEDWENGGERGASRNFHTDEQGYSECCGPTGAAITGPGLMTGLRGIGPGAGTAGVVLGLDALMSAGVSPGAVQRAAGGALAGGAAGQEFGGILRAAGGALAGGQSDQNRGWGLPAAGGALAGGLAAQLRSGPQGAAGGGLGGGRAAQLHALPQAARGGGLGGGLAAQTLRLPYRAAGGGVGGGHAGFSYRGPQRAAGGGLGGGRSPQ